MKYLHVGWCRTGTHDKVWGVICVAEDVRISDAWPYNGNKYVTFWGRRGTKLQTKMVNGRDWEMDDLFRKKKKNGYREIDPQHLNTVYPEFEQDLEKTAFWAALKA
jgi:predicted DNA-binding WGR domain protein